MATAEVLPRYTHEKNATQCPGIIDISPKAKQCAIAVKATALQQGLECAADIEEKMQIMQMEGIKRKLTVEIEEIEEGTAAAEEESGVIILKPKKSSKLTLLCDAISTIKQDQATAKAQINKGTTCGDSDGTTQV
ncbi:hypothetical protein PAXINDRAFT_153391 [Paxillus involutus ATCC 200175]|nr:hypothetical protein PAXINDRAFT_153391 [Paxillus involutus ATCC 200175]